MQTATSLVIKEAQTHRRRAQSHRHTSPRLSKTWLRAYSLPALRAFFSFTESSTQRAAATALCSTQPKNEYSDDSPNKLKAHSHCVSPPHLHASHSSPRVRAIWSAQGACRAICVGNVIRKSLRQTADVFDIDTDFSPWRTTGNWPVEISNAAHHDWRTDHIFLQVGAAWLLRMFKAFHPAKHPAIAQGLCFLAVRRSGELAVYSPGCQAVALMAR